VGGGVVHHPLIRPTEARGGSSRALAVVAEEEVAAAGEAEGGEDKLLPPPADMAGSITSTPDHPRPRQQPPQAGVVGVVGQEPLVAEEGEEMVLPLRLSA